MCQEPYERTFERDRQSLKFSEDAQKAAKGEETIIQSKILDLSNPLMSSNVQNPAIPQCHNAAR